MATEALKKFADELKFIRESKGITLQQIAGKTKIDLKFLQAIEDANFDILPELYMRAFIKEFAQYVDLNTKEILQKYDQARSGKQEEKPQIEKPQEESKHGPEIVQAQQTTKEFDSLEIKTEPIIPPPTPFIKINYIVGGVILLIAVFVVYFAFIKSSSTEIIQEKSSQETVEENNQRYEVQKQIPGTTQSESLPATPIIFTDSLRLSVLVSDRVWVKVSTDGKIVHQQVVQANSRMNFAAKKSFSISVGNAGVVKIFFNNKPVENVGKLGEIRNIFITANAIRYLTITPPQKNEKDSLTKNEKDTSTKN